MDTTSVSYGCEVDEVDADVGVLERLVVVLVDGNGPAVGVPEIGVVIGQVVRFRRAPLPVVLLILLGDVPPSEPDEPVQQVPPRPRLRCIVAALVIASLSPAPPPPGSAS
jgi:hypothetical protein